ncbi:unnamed protein product [Linum tenue]|uniref:Rad21/Rec8-like protein N-terminal domain-containing protein n=1 Tax=Linum tenue TaxID=586396 RepID=A0AAV0MQ96_9ROSI|nr:unnamed protein product [Linum tenue]
MFYSQFILAKKGPLGTIWIAAHLERKLRKNQVADTDIGVSVDSILFPEVPIALRLSSHLLLGVVRIYNRKVNYLFDDCSEALLKIKQAFRSTAVDLPPEESTAPYHSITLPETFDLDDFELPDNDILQGNFVDHHISSREQITLQDTMEGVVYTTSQFGLDERFGDGDTSQVGLELEEELFLNNAAASGTNEVSEVDPRTLIDVTEEPERGERDFRAAASSASVLVNGSGNKIGCLSPNAELAEYAQAPSTPVLVEEPNLSSVQHGLVCDDHFESEDRNSADIHGAESTEHLYSKSDLHHRDGAIDSSVIGRIQCQETEQDVCLVSDLTIHDATLEDAVYAAPVSMEYTQEDGTTSGLQDADKVDEYKEKVVGGVEPVPQPMELMDEKCENSFGAGLLETGPVDASKDAGGQLLDKMVAQDTARVSESCSAPEHVSTEIHPLQGEANLNNNIGDRQMNPSTSMFGLRPCNSNPNDSVLPPDIQPPLAALSKTQDDNYSHGTSTNDQGEECNLADSGLLNKPQTIQTDFEEEVLDGGHRLEDKLDNENQKNEHSEKVDDLPVPEKLLSVPEKVLDRPDELMNASTPVSELLGISNGNGSENRVSGRKRSFTESSLNMQSGNSVESLGLSRTKRTSVSESVPEDDDLLSSILVGRKSSVLRLKPTPPASEMPTAKRSRPTSRLGAFKRKVVMDEMMVLHGDTIRQQLTNTEDIRRLRKKAPCTEMEIVTMQRQFLEDEVLTAPTLSGMVTQLMHLHNETLDLSGIRVVKNEVSSDTAVDVECSATLVNQRGELDKIIEPVDCREIDGEQPVEPPVLDNQDENQLFSACGNVGQKDDIGIVVDLGTTSNEFFEGKLDTGANKENAEETDAPDGFETSHMEHAPLDISGKPVMLSTETSFLGKISHEDALKETNAINELSDEIYTVPAEEETRLKEMNDDELPDGVDMVGHHGDVLVATRSEFILEEELLMHECKDDPAIQITGDQADGNAPCVKPATFDTIGCVGIALVNEQALEHADDGNVRLGSEDGCDVMGFERNVEDKSCSHSEELKMASAHSAGCDDDVKNSGFNDGNNVVSQDANCQTTTNAEVTVLDCLATEDQCEFPDISFTNDTGLISFVTTIILFCVCLVRRPPSYKLNI